MQAIDYFQNNKKQYIDALSKLCKIPSVSKVFQVGVPFQELLKIVEQENPSLVVMGTKGRSNIAGAFLGSTAEKMFRRCPVPLLSVRNKQ